MHWSYESQRLHGKVIYIEGSKSWDVEEGLAVAIPFWMGKEWQRG
jgi:hypothetical protein